MRIVAATFSSLARPILAAVLSALPAVAAAIDTVQVLALTRDRAILSVDGTRRVLRIGDVSPEGVELLQATSRFALVRIDGRERRLESTPVTAPVGTAGPIEAPATGIVLWADGEGFFHAEGEINGHPVRFLVDTGANTVAINERAARRIGLDLSSGRRGRARTAGGEVDVVGVRLAEVSVGPITLYNVDAGVVIGEHPMVPLLGASFLNRIDMNRTGMRMELRKK